MYRVDGMVSGDNKCKHMVVITYDISDTGQEAQQG